MAKIAIGALGWKSHTQSGRLPKASKAARDEIRQIAALMSHTTSKLPPTVQSKAKSTPRAVATPFPPLKRRNTGNMCPRMAAPPAASSQSLPVAPSRCRAISTAKAPFPMSPISVTIPATLPATLSTLVIRCCDCRLRVGRSLPTRVPRRCQQEWLRGDSRSRAKRRGLCPSGGSGICAVTRTHGHDELPDILSGGHEREDQRREQDDRSPVIQVQHNGYGLIQDQQ